MRLFDLFKDDFSAEVLFEYYMKFEAASEFTAWVGGAHHSNSLHGSARTQTSSKSLISAALYHASARESSHYNIIKLQQQKTKTDFNQNP